jgi:hypothetical protein
MQGQEDSWMNQPLVIWTVEKSPFLSFKALEALISLSSPDPSSAIFKGALILV